MAQTAADQVRERALPGGVDRASRRARLARSAAHEKEQWIAAKYAWFGFVEDVAGAGDVERMSRNMCAAAHAGNVARMAWCYAHKGKATWADPEDGGATPLHIAIRSGHASCVMFLLLNGGDLHQADTEGRTPISLAADVDSPEIAQLILEREFDYL